MSAKVACRGYSLNLQRAIVDLGADVSFQEAKKKVKEHYGLELPLSSIQSLVEKHARKIVGQVKKRCGEERVKSYLSRAK